MNDKNHAYNQELKRKQANWDHQRDTEQRAANSGGGGGGGGGGSCMLLAIAYTGVGLAGMGAAAIKLFA